jgi:hypothetical protein
VAACGADRAPSAATGGDGAGDVDAPDRAASSTTGLVSTSTSVAATDATATGPAPIPNDPAALPSCASLPANVMRAEPSRRWLDVPDGWAVRYAYSLRDDPAGTGAPSGWSVLVRSSGAGVAAMVAVHVSQLDEAMQPLPGAARVIRGRPASVAPELSRGGPTGALRAEWRGDGHLFSATARGLSDDELVQLLDRVDVDGMTVGHAPEGWTVLGSGMTETGHLTTTVLGLTPPGGELDAAGYAPVELIVEEAPAGDPASTGPRPPVLDPEGGRIRLVERQGRPGLLARTGDDHQVAYTTDRSGNPVSAGGPVPAERLLDLAADVGPISIDDPRLVGIPMAAAGSSAGAWCRQ